MFGIIALGTGMAALTILLSWVRDAFPSREARDAARLFRETRPFREGQAGERVKCSGRVVIDGPPLIGPLSRRPAAAVCVSSCENGESSFERLFCVEKRIPFAIVTPAGERIDIELDPQDIPADRPLAASWYTRSHLIPWTHEPPPADYVAFAEASGAQWAPAGPAERDHAEWVLPVDEELSMVGEKIAAPGPGAGPAASAYRDSTRHALRVRRVHPGDEETLALVSQFSLNDILMEVAIQGPWWLALEALLVASSLLSAGAALAGR